MTGTSLNLGSCHPGSEFSPLRKGPTKREHPAESTFERSFTCFLFCLIGILKKRIVVELCIKS